MSATPITIPPLLTALIGHLAAAVPARTRTTDLHRAAGRRHYDAPRPRHRRDPGGRADAVLDDLLLVHRVRPLGLAGGLAGAAGGPDGAVRARRLVRRDRRHGGRADLGPGARLADPPQPHRQTQPATLPARPGLAVPRRGGRAGLEGRRGAADAPTGATRRQSRQPEERALPAAFAGRPARPSPRPARGLVHARLADPGHGGRWPHRDRPGASRPGTL